MFQLSKGPSLGDWRRSLGRLLQRLSAVHGKALNFFGYHLAKHSTLSLYTYNTAHIGRAFVSLQWRKGTDGVHRKVARHGNGALRKPDHQ